MWSNIKMSASIIPFIFAWISSVAPEYEDMSIFQGVLGCKY